MRENIKDVMEMYKELEKRMAYMGISKKKNGG